MIAEYYTLERRHITICVASSLGRLAHFACAPINFEIVLLRHWHCRSFYNIEALKKYKWYWRLEPDVEFSCSITYDPFVEMARHKKVYGFTISLWEEKRTCPSLFREVSDWKEAQGIPSNTLWKAGIDASWAPWPFRSLLSWFSHRDRNGDGWNLCHYWSNFEIADLDFFRGPKYQDLYKHLEHTGGFYFERVRTCQTLPQSLPTSVTSHLPFCDAGYSY